MKTMTRQFALAAAAVVIALTAHGADFTTVSVPVGINVEGAYVPSSMYVKMKLKQYNVPLDVFAAGQLDPREATFAALMNSIRDKNYIRAEALLERHPASVQMQHARSRVVQQPRSARETVDLYNKAFNGLRDVSVVSQILMGSKSLFVWQVSTSKGVLRRAFSVSMSDQKLSGTEVNMNDPIALLILDNVMNPMAKDPASYRPVAAMTKRFEYALPVEGPGDPGPNHVVLEFDGQPLDFDVFDEKQAPQDELTHLYRSAFHALQVRAADDYLKNLTAVSREKVWKWFASMTPAMKDSFFAASTAARRLQFVINADPVFLVFYSTPAQPMPRGTMPYDYVLRQADGRLVFANVNRESFLDDVLQNPALFNLDDVRGTGAKQQ